MHNGGLGWLANCWLWCQRLLGHHWSPSGEAHPTGETSWWHMRLARHSQGLLGHVGYRVGVMLRRYRTRRQLRQRVPLQVDLRARNHWWL